LADVTAKLDFVERTRTAHDDLEFLSETVFADVRRLASEEHAA
jgi:hypothetical protein